MAFQLSPGVNVTEIDLTTIVPSVGTTEGGIAGTFSWGPANTIVSVSNEIELVDRFGKPTLPANNYETFFTAANFLSYARNLRVVRAIDASNAKNAANTSGEARLISNIDDYQQVYDTLAETLGTGNTSLFLAKYPGSLGNSLKVSIYPASSPTAFGSWPYNNYFDGKPSTSSYGSRNLAANDEVHIVVVDEDSTITGTANTVLERFAYVSVARDAKNEDGSSNYYVDVLRDQSKYVWAVAFPNGSNWGVTANSTGFKADASNSVVTVSLTGGVDGNPSDANLIGAYGKFRNSDEVDVSLIMMGSANASVSKWVIDNIAEFRKDCVTFVSPRSSDVVNKSGNEVTNITNFRNNILNTSSSYAVLDTGWKYQFDKYNNIYRWVPLNGDIAGLCVRTDFERDPWFSPAGFNRGQLRNVVRLAWNPNKSQRDDLYKIGVNPVVSFPGEGTILYGDKTLLSKPSAFDRINVRRLFIVLEKAIARAAKYSLFEFNDEFTRAQFVALVEPYLRDVQGRRGIYDFRVVCDTTNNTPEVIDRNEFIGDIYIKPARSINFIQLNFVAVRTGVAFEEIVGRF